jgi:hypothetical protein
MKKTISFLTATTFAVAIILTSCDSSSEKVENAQDDVTKATIALDEANREYLTDIEKYRVETAEKILANEKNIMELNLLIANEKKEARADYKKKMDELEQKNKTLKNKMLEYKESGKENWEKFKVEFNRDMEELGSAFKDLTVKNVK